LNRVLKIVVGCILLLFIITNVKAGRLESGFEALKSHDYFKAKAIFYKSLKKDPASASYGLSVIYSRNNNPFYNLDSALFYSKKAAFSYWNCTSEKQKVKYTVYGVDTIRICRQRDVVDEKCYVFAEEKNTIIAYNYFIAQNEGALRLGEAIANRNKLAYKNSQKVNTSSAYKVFMETYPNAIQMDDVKARYQQQLFKEYTADGSIESHVLFVKEQPGNFYVTQAQKNIYKLATKEKSITAYLSFIKTYPKNPSVSRAWRNVYNISTQVRTSDNIKNFLKNYPDYPFKEELEQDYILANTVYYPIKKNNKWGFVNESLEEEIKPIYDWVSEFHEGAAVSVLNEKYGFINKNNAILIPFEYDETESFLNGLSVVSKNDKYGIINRTGEPIVPLIYDYIGSTKNEFISVELDSKYGFIDHKGDLKVGLQYETVGDFNNGIAYVKQDGLFGIIDTNLMYVVKPKYQWIDNLKDTFIRVQEKDSFGVINPKGEYLVAPIYNQITEVENGYAIVVKDGKYGYLNERGEIVLPMTLDYVEGVVNWGGFNEIGYARIISENNFGLIDTLGKRFVPALFEDVGSVSPDLIAIKRHGKWGYCDYETKLKIPYNFDYADQFSGDFAIVQFKNYYGIINKKGSYVIESEYEELIWFRDQIMFKQEGLYGLMNLDKEELLPKRYDKIEISKDGKFLKLFTKDSFDYLPIESIKVG
jgi:hypothetical protein